MQSYPPPSDQTPPGGGSALPPPGGQTPPPGSPPSLPGYEQWARPDPYTPMPGSPGIIPASPLTPPPPPASGQTLWPTVSATGAPVIQTLPPPTQAPRRSLTWLWIIALVVVFLAGLGLGDVIGTLTATPKANSTTNRSAPSVSTTVSNTSTTATVATGSTATTSSPTATPASSSSSSTANSSGSVHHKVGEAVTFNNTWQITLNSVQTSPGQGFDQPQAGDQYLLLDITLLNVSNDEQEVAADFNFTLRDTEGREIQMAFVSFASPPPTGKVEPQQKIRGTLVYEVPQSQHDFVLSFSDIMQSGQLFWDIHV
ncbi:MAG: DUF4352 domain-containing protein [Thermogemmatispora sp.]|uniref:DUF4352 domain-containing protein n=1 Tax=Thermogemmatispora sp. TaxID=1968838 RepID=UPI0026264967|nr:DUF4352 domain-containing protein [Thermogemmatispora sp.]MBX5457247.1 DUF4352 domain-containing protein [Thermogemmatispora sp.]